LNSSLPPPPPPLSSSSSSHPSLPSSRCLSPRPRLCCALAGLQGRSPPPTIFCKAARAGCSAWPRLAMGDTWPRRLCLLPPRYPNLATTDPSLCTEEPEARAQVVAAGEWLVLRQIRKAVWLGLLTNRFPCVVALNTLQPPSCLACLLFPRLRVHEIWVGKMLAMALHSAWPGLGQSWLYGYAVHARASPRENEEEEEEKVY